MAEIKWDIRRGAEIYRTVYDGRLKNWISTGKIKKGEVLVWKSGFSGWRRPEELDELRPFFERWEKGQLEERKRERVRRMPPSKKQIKNILLIEDEKDICALLSESLVSKGYNVKTARTRREGINYLKKNSPDLVFLDLNLPDGDGMSVLSQMRKSNPKTIPAIISAYGSADRREEARRKGAYVFIDKPFTDREIFKVIRQLQR
ncbi:MAG: response regulator [Candidatus Aureabacteria bacterium]|nr:response regulator [Candidatus Auribacterota bacterium]